jgi:replicative DNA helicase
MKTNTQAPRRSKPRSDNPKVRSSKQVSAKQRRGNRLPAILKSGGLVEIALAQTADQIREDESACELYDQLENDLFEMRTFFLSHNPSERINLQQVFSEILSGEFWQSMDDEEDQMEAMLTGGFHSKGDVVFRFCLACHENLKNAITSLRAEAFARYFDRTDDYDMVLGDLVPKELREEVHQRHAQLAYSEGTNARAVEDWDVYLHELATQQAREQPLGLPTGQQSLDQKLGGIRGLTVIAGGIGVGKTSLALSISIAALRETPDLAVLYYSLDMPKSTVFDWLICHDANVSFRSLRKGTLASEEAQRVEVAKRRLRSEILPRLRIVERPTPFKREVFTQHRIYQDLTQLMRAAPANRILTVIDLFHLMDVPNDISTDNERNEFRLKSLRSFCDPDRFPVIVLSKVRKAHAGRKVLAADDLFGSVDLAFQADNVLLMEKAGDSSAATTSTVVRIVKGRDSELGDVKLNFHFHSHRFSSLKRRKRPSVSTAARDSRKRKPKSVDPLAGN